MTCFRLASRCRGIECFRGRKRSKQSPGLNPEGLLGSALYFDAQVEFAERLVVENVLAARERGAEVFTYAPVTKFVVEGGFVSGVEFDFEGQLNFARARGGHKRGWTMGRSVARASAG